MSSSSETGATLSVRLHDQEVAAIDALVADLSARARGVRVTRSDAARVAIEYGLRALAAESSRSKK